MVILDIEKPKSCRTCDLWQRFDDIADECKAADKLISGVDINSGVPEWCPIKGEIGSGEWIEKDVRGGISLYCSVCGEGIDVIYRYRHCPNCGSIMK